MFFPQSKVKGLLDLIRWVHTNPPWEDPKGFFTLLHQIIPFDYSVAFMKMDPKTYKVIPFPFTLSNGGGDDAAVIRDYNDHFWQFKRPILDRIMKGQFQTFHVPDTVETYLPKAQFEEFQTDFWQKHKIQFCYVRYMKTRQGWLSIYLSRRPGTRNFSEEEKMFLDLLSPHLALIVAQNESKSPCLFADAQGQVVCTDPLAETTLKRDSALAARLRAELPRWVKWQSSEPVRSLCLDISEKRETYRILVSPAGTGRSPLFRVSWTEPNTELPLPVNILESFAQQYRLSPRERDILACVVAGKQMKEMAQQLGLAVDTVKEYLGTLYRKVDVDGRGPLVAKLLSSTVFNMANAGLHPSPLTQQTAG